MQKFFAVAIALASVSISFFTAEARQVKVATEQFTLQNGLHVILHEDHTLPVAAVNLWYRVGSARERAGRTGFAHLFEHLMFMGSKNVPSGHFDQWLESSGGDNNASTTNDRTNYFENLPGNALALPLFLESDRMGFLVDSMTPAKVDLQRNVVKNERRESYENRPYGRASLLIDENLFPSDFPYHWPVIGSMEDLSAASYQDVVDFFRTYYVPQNASLVIAGDIDPGKTKEMVEHWFADVPAGKDVPPLRATPPALSGEKRVVLEDKVQLPRLYCAWQSPAQFAPGSAEMNIVAFLLAGGKNSRLYKRLVYDMQIAQDVTSYTDEGDLCSRFYVIATARAGHTLGEIETVMQEEIDSLRRAQAGAREIQRAVHQIEAYFLNRLESLGEKADQINAYYCATGSPDYFDTDLERYQKATAEAIRSAAQSFLRDNGRVVLSVVPEGHRELAAPAGKEGK